MTIPKHYQGSLALPIWGFSYESPLKGEHLFSIHIPQVAKRRNQWPYKLLQTNVVLLHWDSISGPKFHWRISEDNYLSPCLWRRGSFSCCFVAVGFFFGGLSGCVMSWSICALELLTLPMSSLFKPVLILSQILALVLEPREIGTHPSYGSKAVLGLLVLSSVSEHAFFWRWHVYHHSTKR